MSYCWKCGQPVAEGRTECEYGCGANLAREPLLPETLARFNALYCEIDWRTIKSLEDLIKVLSVIHEGEGIFSDSPYHRALKKFLRPPIPPESI
jgi:hypothetical protein